MRLIRFGEKGHELPGIIDAHNKRKDLSGFFKDWNRDFFEEGGLHKLANWLRDIKSLPDVPQDARWASCVARPGKVICIGLNYSDHAEESGMPVPAEPIVFLKASNTVIGPYDDVLIPRKSEKTDWEVELGVVIGKDTRYLASVEDAKNAIAGYCISHDVSERSFQLERGGSGQKENPAITLTP